MTGFDFEFSSLDRYNQYITTSDDLIADTYLYPPTRFKCIDLQIRVLGAPVPLSCESVASLVDCRGKARSVRRTKQASHRSVLDGLRTSLTGPQQFLVEVAGEKGFPLG